MQPFDEIWDRAVDRHGEDKVRAHLPQPLPAAALARIPDDRWLAEMAKRVFAAGFVWRVIEAKWEGFEAAFDGFDPGRVADYDSHDLERLQGDPRIVRNGQKIQATVHNAAMVQRISAQHGGFGRWVADWPDDDIVGLWEALGREGSRLGGATGAYLLRFMGKDTFILSKDVGAALVAAGVVDKHPTGKRALRATQDAFNAWSRQSGMPRCQLSRVLGMSIDA